MHVTLIATGSPVDLRGGTTDQPERLAEEIARFIA
jgi:hypothetical protein